MSFKEEGELSMFPVAEEIKGHLVDEQSAYPLLKTAVIYGANASGKSSLIKSMRFAQEFILKNEWLNMISSPAYKLDTESVNAPSSFCFEIKVSEERIFQYGFSVQFNRNQVVEEFLYELKAGEDEDFCFFHRKRTMEGETDFVYYSGLESEPQVRLQIYAEEVDAQSQGLLLTKLGTVGYGQGEFWEMSKEVFAWFKKLTVFFPETRCNLLSAVVDDEMKVNQLYQIYFRIFGIDIDNIHLAQVPVRLLGIEPEVRAELRKGLLAMKEEEGGLAMLNLGGKEYLMELDEDGELTAQEVKFRHRNGEKVADFAKDEESDGTQRLFDLIPALARLIMLGGVLVIDEIDRSLHTLLTRKVIKEFLAQKEEVRGQLVCTTHDVKLLDLSLLRSDEIWFVHKEKGSASRLSPLAEYRLEYPDNVEVNYLNGAYGGIPVFDE